MGLGHVTRMMAIGDELRDQVDPVIFTLSAALPIPTRAGFTVEHLASADRLGVPVSQWHALLDDRIDQLVDAYEPDVLLFDGVHPYRGLREALHRHRKRLRRVWVRRAMWRQGVDADVRELAAPFDHIVEPGEYASDYDRGATVAARRDVVRVAPICYRAGGERPDRQAACRALGVHSENTNVLVQLGAGQINDVNSTVGAVATELAGRSGVGVAVARSVLSARATGGDGSSTAVEVREFPITHWMAAFDAAIIAGGYNSFHEALSIGIPSVVVPNLHTRTDDQDARSRWADDHGMAIRWDDADHARLPDVVDRLLDPAAMSQTRDRLSTLPPADGAHTVATLVAGWVR